MGFSMVAFSCQVEKKKKLLKNYKELADLVLFIFLIGDFIALFWGWSDPQDFNRS